MPSDSNVSDGGVDDFTTAVDERGVVDVNAKAVVNVERNSDVRERWKDALRKHLLEDLITISNAGRWAKRIVSSDDFGAS